MLPGVNKPPLKLTIHDATGVYNYVAGGWQRVYRAQCLYCRINYEVTGR